MTTNSSNRQSPVTFAEAIELEKELQATLAGKVPELVPVTLAPTDPNEPTSTPIPTDDAAETLKKRISDKDRYIQTLSDAGKAKDAEIERWKQEAADAQAKASTKPNNVTDAQIEKFAQEYPEATTIISEMIERRAKELSKEETKALEDKFRNEGKVNVKKLEDKQKLLERYPNFKEYEKPDGVFIEWLGKQSATIQRLAVYENTHDIDAVISVLDMFTAQVQVKRPSGQTKQVPLSANPVTNSPVDITQPRGQFDIAKWNKDMETAQKKGDRKTENRLMEEFEAAGGLALFNKS